jgi:DNA gyrase inhibitor GyrI
MSKSFLEVFEEWKKDSSYQIGEDCGEEQVDNLNPDSTSGECSSTPKDHGSTHSA